MTIKELREQVGHIPGVPQSVWIFNRCLSWECGRCRYELSVGYIPDDDEMLRKFWYCPACGARMVDIKDEHM